MLQYRKKTIKNIYLYIFSGGLTMIRNNRDVNRLETGLNRIQESINRFSGDYFNQEIKDLWEKMKRNEGKEKLKTMPIDVISTLVKDTLINQLVNNGFRTIYDIENQEPAQLMRINISEKNAYLIYNTDSKIKESVYQQAIPRLNQDNLSKENIELLASIYKKWELLNVIETLRVDFEKLNKVVSPDIETIKKQKGLIGSL